MTNPTTSQGAEEMVERLNSLQQYGHCGESTSEAIARGRFNEVLDQAASLLLSQQAEIEALKGERDEARAETRRMTTEVEASAEAYLDIFGRLKAAEAAIGRKDEALRPFAAFAEDNTERDMSSDGGPGFGIWSGNRCERERICDWFGPSDFWGALAALQPQEGKADAR